MEVFIARIDPPTQEAERMWFDQPWRRFWLLSKGLETMPLHEALELVEVAEAFLLYGLEPPGA